MPSYVTRRDFIKHMSLTAGALGAWSLVGPDAFAADTRRNMCGFAAPALDRVRVGVVGLGMRGPGAVERLAKMKDVDILALCDSRPEGVKRSQDILKNHGRGPAREFTAGPEDWRHGIRGRFPPWLAVGHGPLWVPCAWRSG